MADDTRTRLIDSAFALLREAGLEAVTLRAVGDRAGLSRTAPYRHFADKTALLAALAARIITDLSDHIAEAALGRTDLRDRSRAFYTGYVDYAMEHPEEYRLVFAQGFQAGDHPEVERAIDRAAGVLNMMSPPDALPTKAEFIALLATAHGLAELATIGHFAEKGVSAADVIDVIVGG